MKKIFLSAVLFLSASYAFVAPGPIAPGSGKAIFSIDTNGNITTNSSFINAFYPDKNLPNEIYTTSNPISFQLANKIYSVKTAAINRYANNPEFNVIEILRNNQIIFTVKQPEDWTILRPHEGMTGDLSAYSDNDYFISVPLSSSAVALMFVGWPYGGDMPLLTIIVLTENDAKLVYNKNVNINSITKTNNSFSMQVQSNIIERDESGQPFNNEKAITYTIRLENGVLTSMGDEI